MIGQQGLGFTGHKWVSCRNAEQKEDRTHVQEAPSQMMGRTRRSNNNINAEQRRKGGNRSKLRTSTTAGFRALLL